MTRNYNIDGLRLIACLAVIMIHVAYELGFEAKNVFEYMSRSIMDLAVPYFLVVTGYFITSRTDIAERSKHFFWLWSRATVIYLVLGGALHIINYLVRPDYEFMSFFYPRSAVNVLNGTIGDYHLWYLLSASAALGLIHLGKRKNIPEVGMFIFGLFWQMEQSFLTSLFKTRDYIKVEVFLTH